MSSTPRFFFIPVAFAPLAIVAGTVLTSCGGGGSTTSSAAASTTTAPGNRNAQLQAFRDCMQTHGVTIPTAPPRTGPPPTDNGGTGGGGGGRGFGGGAAGLGQVMNSTDPATVTAFNACKSTIPAAVLQQIQQGQTARQAFVSCMKDHGVTVSNTGGGFGGGGPNATTSSTTPAYGAAFNVCKALLPQRTPRSSTTTIA